MIIQKNILMGPLAYWLIQTLAALTLFLAPLVVTGDPLPADTYYVAPDGDDNNPGTLEFPLKSLEAARQKVRDHKATFGLGTEGIAVILREGTWIRSQSFVLSSQDGGEPGRPVIWRAFPGETVRVLGAATVQADWFEPVTSAHAEWSRLPAEARGNVLRTRLSHHGLTDYGQLKVRGYHTRKTGALELFADEELMPLARWPDPDQHDGQPSYQDFQLTFYGSTQPDVSGGWTKFGTRDGVNAYTRDDPVNGIPYYLYRYSWQSQDNWHTAWFIAAQDDGYPGSNPHPWWSVYSEDLGIFAPSNGATGKSHLENPAAIKWGFAVIENRLSASRFTVATDRLSRWTSATDLWFHGLWEYLWADEHINASSIDPATRTVTLAKSPLFGLEAGKPFYALNLLEEITRPGEWYLERSTGFLYWWPKGAIGSQEIMVSMLEEPLLRVENAEHLQFADLSFGMGRQDLATVEGGTDVVFERCRFFGAGNDGIHLAGENHRLEHSEVVDTGDRGVVLNGGERRSLSPGNNLVENSEIHRFGRWSWMYQPGIHVQGVGHRVAHNHIHDAPHSAILFEGNEHLIEYNEVNNVVNFSGDAAAIYFGGQGWGGRGNRVEFNYIHHIDSPLPSLLGVHGVYLDDILSGGSVFGNLFVEVSGKAMVHGGGRDNLFENNIVVRSGTVLASDSRGVGWITDPARSGLNLLEMLGDDGVEYQKEPWCSTYPELCVVPNDWSVIAAPGSLWKYPEGSVFSRNLGWQNLKFTREYNWGGTGTFNKFAEIKDNLEDTDPRFVDEAGGDYRLAADSPALSIPGFVDIPFEQMGIQMGIVEPPPVDEEPPPVDEAPSLILVAQVTNNNGGTAVPADWTLSASGGLPLHLDSYGSTQPDVSGGWTKFGTRDGVNAYTRDDPVNGIPYYLYRYSWQYQDKWHTAWFIAAQDDGYPGSNPHPWWSLYSQDLGTFHPSNGATGNPTIETSTPVAFSGPGPSVSNNTNFEAGSYILSAISGWSGYTASAWSCDGGSLQGATLTLAQGESATCTITNDDEVPSLSLENIVVNNNGGTAVPADWTLSASGSASGGPPLHLDSYGSTQPDVSGGWTKFGTRDGVNAYTRDDPVNGIAYYLYRYTWQSQDKWHTAWFIAAQDDGYPGPNPHPWWSLYSQDLGTFHPSNGATGNPTIETPVASSGVSSYGSTQPDVSGGWTKFGTRDGVNAYTRDDPVNGIPYYLYRYSWQYQDKWHTAWFIAAQDDGYPGSNPHPWWSLYSQDLGTFHPSNGATGNPTIETPVASSGVSSYGSTQPDVSGGWTKFGTRDGVNAYTRDDPVNGIPYYLYRYSWQYQDKWHTAWFIAAQDDGYPGSNPHPWWSLYSQDLGTFHPSNGATGNPTIETSTPTSVVFSGPGPSVSSNANFQAGTYILSQSADPAGYTASSWSCAGGSLNGSALTIVLGESASCTITNDDN